MITLSTDIWFRASRNQSYEGQDGWHVRAHSNILTVKKGFRLLRTNAVIRPTVIKQYFHNFGCVQIKTYRRMEITDDAILGSKVSQKQIVSLYKYEAKKLKLLC
jgi:hypothetical protein